ncbi:MAG: hypothetical protein CVV23_06540 [Ignavibacteriae bacterium HGW-Ignavibacteriae-2]|jgi:hypothetical protein|nr:hypothetical protein [Bacteroidota bacterium]PKL89148.1 MAG: hypothetical protein CVV23_06540 [Ignavibacteriae bacterium HGW-Ignavibacteriae-2]
MKPTHQDRIDSLISHFWRNGYLTVSRKFGTYLPPPRPIGNYEIDAVGKYKKAYVFGLVLTENDFNNPRIKNKIEYLASQNTKYSNRRVKLYIGVPKPFFENLNNILSELPKENRDNIKIIIIN